MPWGASCKGFCIPPRDSGEGGPHEVRWAWRLHRSFSRRRRIFLIVRAPSTMLRMVPPAIAGADARSRSRDALGARVIFQAVRKFRLERTGGIHLASPENKGGGAPNGAPPVPASERDAGAVIRDRSPFGAPPRLCAEIFQSQLGL